MKTVFKYDTRRIGDRHYLVCSRLVSTTRLPEHELEYANAFAGELRDERGKLQWALDANPDYGKVLAEERVAPDEIRQIVDDRRYLIVHRPQEPTPEELAAEALQERRLCMMEALPDLLLDATDAEDLVRRIKEARDGA